MTLSISKLSLFSMFYYYCLYYYVLCVCLFSLSLHVFSMFLCCAVLPVCCFLSVHLSLMFLYGPRRLN